MRLQCIYQPYLYAFLTAPLKNNSLAWQTKLAPPEEYSSNLAASPQTWTNRAPHYQSFCLNTAHWSPCSWSFPSEIGDHLVFYLYKLLSPRVHDNQPSCILFSWSKSLEQSPTLSRNMKDANITFSLCLKNYWKRNFFNFTNTGQCSFSWKKHFWFTLWVEATFWPHALADTNHPFSGTFFNSDRDT